MVSGVAETMVLVCSALPGALMLLRRADLLAVPLRESFQHCGEDITLCLDLRRQLGKSAYLASAVTAIHNPSSRA